MLTSDEHESLSVINAARSAFGLTPMRELPQARRGESSNCVLARALHGIDPRVSVGNEIKFTAGEAGERAARLIGHLTGASVSGSRVECPPALRRLWGAFDDQQTPEYESPYSEAGSGIGIEDEYTRDLYAR